MKKNMLVSNVSSENLLNGEINNTSVNINNEIKNFDTHQLYDRIIGVLEVDEDNKAILYTNNHFNFKVFIRKNGRTILSDRLENITLNDSIYQERLIDTIEPFSNIEVVYRDGHGVDINASKTDLIKKYNRKPINTTDYEYDKIYRLNRQVKTDVRTFVKIPKFYYRTYFLEKNNKYFRNYEIISVDTFNSLSDDLKTGFYVPSAFYTWITPKLHDEVTIYGQFDNTNNCCIYDLSGIKHFNFGFVEYNDNRFSSGVVTYDSITDTFTITTVISGDYINNCIISDDKLLIYFNENFTPTDYNELTLEVTNDANNDVYKICIEKRDLLISNSPVTQNWGGMPTGNKLNIFECTLNTIQYQGFDIESDFMDIETYYGVICYLIRIYAGVFDIYELFQASTEAHIISKLTLNNKTVNSQDKGIFFEYHIKKADLSNNNFFNSGTTTLNPAVINDYIKLTQSNFYGIYNCYLVSTSSNINNIISTSDISTKIISITSSSQSGPNYISELNLSSISNGEYFITNVFITKKEGVSDGYSDQTEQCNDFFRLQKSGSSITLYNNHLDNFYVNNKKLYFKNTHYPIGNDYYLCFFIYNIDKNMSTFRVPAKQSLYSKVISLNIARYDNSGTIVKECVIDCFNSSCVNAYNTCLLKNCIIYPKPTPHGVNEWLDINEAKEGASLNNALNKDYLVEMFSNFNASEFGDDEIVITVHNNYWNHINGVIENNNYFPLRIFNEKNKRMNSIINILNIVGLFTPPTFDYYKNLDLCLNKNWYVSRFDDSGDIITCFDYVVDSHYMHTGVLVQGISFNNQTSSLSVTLKNKETQTYEYIDNEISSYNNENVSIQRFYCDNLDNCDLINNVYYYKQSLSYIEIPIENSSEETNVYFMTENTKYFNKRSGHQSQSDMCNCALLSSLFNDYNYSDISTVNNNNYIIRPSLYSIILTDNCYPMINFEDVYSSSLVMDSYIEYDAFAGNQSNNYKYFLNYKYNNFIIKQQ